MKRKQVVSLMLMLSVAFSMCVPTMAAPKAPAKVTSLSVSKSGSTATVKWKKLKKKPSGYAVYQKKGSSSWKLIKRASKNASSVKLSIKTTEQNQFKVRAYKTYKVKKYYNKKTKKYVSKKVYKKLAKKNRKIKKVTAYKYGKYSPTKTLAAVKTNTNTNTNTDSSTAKYTYTLGKAVGGAYTNRCAILYIKTDDPAKTYEFKVRLTDSNNKQTIISANSGEYALYNIKNWSSNADGGKIIPCNNLAIGQYKVEVQNWWEDTAWVSLGTIDVVDSEQDAWYQSVIDRATTSDMTPKEKMTAIAKWIRTHSYYRRNVLNAEGKVIGVENENVEYALHGYTDNTLYLNSADSPALLVKFGEFIGYKMESMFCDEGSTKAQQWKNLIPDWNWKSYHYLAIHVNDDGTYDTSTLFDACNGSSKNVVDGRGFPEFTINDDEYIDLSQY